MKSTHITDFFKSKASSTKKEQPKQNPDNQNGAKEDQQKIEIVSNEVNNFFPAFPHFAQGLGSWLKPLETFVSSNLFQQMYKFIEEEYKTKTVYPKKEDIFNAFKLTPLSRVKAVIVGQDPYHGPGQAHGLCFSVQKPIKPPPSLINIYKNLEDDPEIFFKRPTHGDLSNWAKQGVLLLNATLTVVQSKPNSHEKCGWQRFTDQVIRIIDRECEGVVFFLWGSFAHNKGACINQKKHFVLKTTHPSPFSADKGFLTSHHFSKCNSLLASVNKTPINWNVDPDQ